MLFFLIRCTSQHMLLSNIRSSTHSKYSVQYRKITRHCTQHSTFPMSSFALRLQLLIHTRPYGAARSPSDRGGRWAGHGRGQVKPTSRMSWSCFGGTRATTRRHATWTWLISSYHRGQPFIPRALLYRTKYMMKRLQLFKYSFKMAPVLESRNI